MDHDNDLDFQHMDWTPTGPKKNVLHKNNEKHICSVVVNYSFESIKTFCSFWCLAFTFFSISHSHMVLIIFSYLNLAVVLTVVVPINDQQNENAYTYSTPNLARFSFSHAPALVCVPAIAITPAALS